MTVKTWYNHNKLFNLLSPVSLTVALQPVFASMRNYNGATLLVQCGALADSPVLQIRQAKNVAGSALKHLTVDRYASNLVTNSPAEDSDKWLLTDSPVSTIALAANTNYAIPIRPAMLDVSNNFDCIGIEIEDPGSGANLIAAQFILHDGPMGITDDTNHIPSAAVNRMPN